MCFSSGSKPQRYQDSKAPVFRTGPAQGRKKGRRGTILTDENAPVAPLAKKQALGA